MATEYTAGYSGELKKTGVNYTDPSGFVKENYDVAIQSDQSVQKDWWRPRTDVLEDDENVIVEFELPGVKSDDILLTATENSLTLSSKKEMTEKEKSGTFYMKERHFGNFYRKIILPDYVNVNQREALMENGVLRVTMPIKAELGTQTTPIKINIHPQ